MKKKFAVLIMSLCFLMTLFSGMQVKAADQYSEWSTTKPSVDESLIETKTCYRYRDALKAWTQTGSGTINYARYQANDTASTWPSGFLTSASLYKTYNNTPVTAYNNGTQKREVTNKRIGYIYWHWCMNSYAYGPINRKISSKKTSTYTGFHAFYSTTDYAYDSSANARKCKNASVCKDTYWWLNERVPIYQNTYKTYTLQYSGQWSDWSGWSDAYISGSDTRQVESAVFYRYNITKSRCAEGHTWLSWTTIKAATYLKTGTKQKTCSVCGIIKIATIPKKCGTTLVSVTNKSSQKLVIKWKVNKKVTGYQIELGSDSKFGSSQKRSCKGYSKNSCTISNRTKGKTYYIRVRTYTKSNYSGWSSVKKVKITK